MLTLFYLSEFVCIKILKADVVFVIFITKLMETRPKIKLPLEPLDKTLEISGKFIILLIWILALIAFFKMPDTIPIHFNAAGQPDNYGNKGTIFILPIIATIIFIGLTILNRYPHIFNYVTAITEANASDQYLIATRMIRFIKLIIAIVFTAIVLITFLTSVNITNGLGSWFLPLTIGLIFIPTIYSIIMSFTKK